MAATLIEPVWVVVTRYLALYQPWTELNSGDSSPAASLGLKYTTLSPLLIAPRALFGRHYILSLASAVVLASSGLAVALGGLFESDFGATNHDATFEFPLSRGIETQIQTKGVSGTFAKDGEVHWLIANSNISFRGALPPWVAPEFYLLPFEWDTAVGDKSDLRSAKTWGVGVNLTCKLLEGDVYRQQSWAGISGGSAPKPAVSLNVTIPTAGGGAIRCNNSLVELAHTSLKTGAFAGEYLFGLGPTDRADKEAEDFCNSLLVVGWNRGSITVEERNSSTVKYTMDMDTYANTTILCMQTISSAEFNVVVDNSGHVRESKRLTPLTYDDSSLFKYSTTITNFKAQLSTITRTNPYSDRDIGGIHNDDLPRSLPHAFITSGRGRRLYSPGTPPPSFEEARSRFQDVYRSFTAIVIGQNSERIFRSTTKDGGRKPKISGYRTSLQNRVSMDRVTFYVAATLLGFSALASIIIFTARPKRFLPRVPDTLAAEIGFYYASEALGDTAGTAHMSSAMREWYLVTLGWDYGYGKFMGKDGKLHLGVERMEPIDDLRNAP